MEPAGIITASVSILTALGGGIAFLINRADKRRDRNEALLIEHLRDRVRQLEAQLAREQRIRHIVAADGRHWREQLIENDIKPEPADWTDIPEGTP